MHVTIPHYHDSVFHISFLSSREPFEMPQSGIYFRIN